jgi:predicted amidohydrolase YtcJ
MSELLVVGRLYTMDPGLPVAGAALIRGGEFACVGSRSDCALMAGPAVRTLDLGHGSATPGLADAHLHVLGVGRARLELSCAGSRSEEECAERAAARSGGLPPGRWLRGRGWDQNAWPGGAFPGERSLSRTVPDRPAALLRVDGHALWVNARALAVAGITAATPDPPGGRIARRPGGQPSGLLVDNAMDLVLSRIPPPRAATPWPISAEPASPRSTTPG